jgi:uncharacterized membrane protein YfcA
VKSLLLLLLGLVAAAFVLYWIRALRASARTERVRPTPYELLVGLITDFFDALGIGSFATTTVLYRLRRTIDDRLLPGTLNVGHTIPTFAQAFLFTTAVEVESLTLVAMIGAAVAGALLGAPVVARWPRRRVQAGMGCALLILTAVLIWRQIGLPEGAGTLGLSGAKLALGVAGNFVLGALMTIGVGLYAPCLVLVSLLGMTPKTGFPIMMCSCAFLMPLASVPFVRQGSYAPRAALGLTLAGLPAVLLAVFVVKELPLYWVKWMVAVVVIYTALTLLRAATREPAEPTGGAVAT